MISYQFLFDRTSQAQVLYTGQAPAGAKEDEEKWCIRKISFDVDGKVLSIQTSNGSTEQNIKWTDRLTTEYK